MTRRSSSYWQDYPVLSTLPAAADYNDIEATLDAFCGPGRTYPVSAKYKLAADLSLTSGTNTQLTGWTKVSDKDSIFASNAATIPLAGRKWRIKTEGRFAGSAGGGYRYLYLVINGTTVSTTTILAQGGEGQPSINDGPGDYRQAEYRGPLNLNDVIRVFAVQSSGAALSLTAATQSASYGDTWLDIDDDGPA